MPNLTNLKHFWVVIKFLPIIYSKQHMEEKD